MKTTFQRWTFWLETSFWHRQLLFITATVFEIFFMGYYFGTFDQASHIPFLKQLADPSLYPNDPFLALRFTKYSYFWNLFVPFLRWGILEYAMFIVYGISIFLTFFFIWRLSQTLFRSSLISFVIILVFLLPHFGFGFIPIFEFSLVNRVVVLPFILWAIDEYLNERYVRAFALAGILMNFHALSVVFLLVIFGVDILFRFFHIGMRRLLLSGCVFLLTALPILMWKFSSSGVHFTANWSWFHDVAQGSLGHIYDLWLIWPPYLLSTITGLTLIGLGFFYLYPLKRISRHSAVFHFYIGILVGFIAHAIACTLYPSEFIIQFQLSRIGMFAVLFTYMYATKSTIELSTKGKFQKQRMALSVLLATSVIPFTFIAGLAVFYINKSLRMIWILVTIQMIGILIILFAVIKMEVAPFGIHIFAPQSPEVDVQLWVKNNSSKDAMMIAPPYLWGMYSADWRVFSERGMIAGWGELLEIAFTPSQYADWVARFDDVAPGARSQFDGYFLDNQKFVRDAYLSLSSAHILMVKNKYNASYFITEKHRVYPFPSLYENQLFRVYDLRSESEE